MIYHIVFILLYSERERCERHLQIKFIIIIILIMIEQTRASDPNTITNFLQSAQEAAPR